MMWRVEAICVCGESATVEADEFSFALVCPNGEWSAVSYDEWVYESVYCPSCSLQLQDIGAQHRAEAEAQIANLPWWRRTLRGMRA